MLVPKGDAKPGAERRVNLPGEIWVEFLGERSTERGAEHLASLYTALEQTLQNLR